MTLACIAELTDAERQQIFQLSADAIALKLMLKPLPAYSCSRQPGYAASAIIGQY